MKIEEVNGQSENCRGAKRTASMELSPNLQAKKKRN